MCSKDSCLAKNDFRKKTRWREFNTRHYNNATRSNGNPANFWNMPAKARAMAESLKYLINCSLRAIAEMKSPRGAWTFPHSACCAVAERILAHAGNKLI